MILVWNLCEDKMELVILQKKQRKLIYDGYA